jgi:hypothetical protein
MNSRLRDEDRRAVDLLLDRAAAGQGVKSPAAGNGDGNGNGNGRGHGQPAGFATASGDVASRLPAVQKVLQLLDLLADDEPPRDLLTRTLDRVAAASANHPSALRPPAPSVDAGMRPHA